MFISIHSILGWVSFCMNYCINAAWHEDDQPVALLRCNEDQVAWIVAFRSSALLVLVSLIIHCLWGSAHLLCWVWCLSSRFSGVQVRWVCWPIKHSNTMVIEPGFGTVGSVCRCQVLMENEISISIKLVSRRKHEVLLHLLVDVWTGLQKTQWTNTSRRHSSPNHLCGNFTLDFQQHGFCVSPLFLQTLDLDLQMKYKIYFNLKRGLWSTGQQSSSSSP